MASPRSDRLAKLIATFYDHFDSVRTHRARSDLPLSRASASSKFLLHIKEEILLVLATSSSETAIPTLMEKLEKLGCSRSLVGLVVPTGYTFNTDGSSLYMTLAALFVAQATHTHLTLLEQLTIFLGCDS